MSDMVVNSVWLAGLLFAVGTLGVMIHRHPVIIFMCIELMLNAGNLALVAFNRHHYTANWRSMDGQIYAFLIIVIAAAEVAVGLAIIVALFKHRARVDIDEINFLKR